jgi:hypothetical protein
MRQQLNLPKTTPRQDDMRTPGTEAKITVRSILPRIKSYLRSVESIHPQDSSRVTGDQNYAALASRQKGGMAR